MGGQETGVVGKDARESSPDGEGRLTPSSGAEEGTEGLKWSILQVRTPKTIYEFARNE